MALLEKITEEWKAAMRSGDKERRDTLSLVRAAVKDAEISARGDQSAQPTGDEAVQRVIEREAKKRRDAIGEYEKAGRPDRAESERAELKILQEFLPEQLSEAEIETLARQAMAETGASGPKAMGQVMSALRPRTQGRADGQQVSAIVRRLLNEAMGDG
jgi:uncharacterized protein YqeY